MQVQPEQGESVRGACREVGMHHSLGGTLSKSGWCWRGTGGGGGAGAIGAGFPRAHMPQRSDL